MKLTTRLLTLSLILYALTGLTVPALAAQTQTAPEATTMNETGGTPQTGSLIISSVITAPEGFPDDKVITYVVKDQTGTIVASPSITGNGSIAVTKLIMGDSYTITELDPCEKGYGYKIAVSGAISKNGGSVAIGGLPQRIDFYTGYIKAQPDSVPKTGVEDSLPLLFTLAGLTGTSGAALMLKSRRKERSLK